MKTIVVVGCSRFGARIASNASSKGKLVSVIDLDKSSFIKLDSSYSGFKIEGDATEIPVLEKARIGDCVEIDIMTDDDNVNIFIASLVEHFYPSVSKIFIRLKEKEKVNLLKNKNVYVIDPLQLSIDEYENLRRIKK